VLLTVGVAALVAAALVDLRSRIVPNRLVLIIAVCGIGIQLLSSPGWIWLSLLASASIVVVLGLLAHHDLMGGGDVKLIGAVALLFPASEILSLLLSVAIAGGAMSCIYLVLRANVMRIPKARFCSSDPHEETQNMSWSRENLLSGERLRIAAGEPMPYAFAVLGGVLYRIVS
jgi:prepilin peptidase CpaA